MDAVGVMIEAYELILGIKKVNENIKYYSARQMSIVDPLRSKNEEDRINYFCWLKQEYDFFKVSDIGQKPLFDSFKRINEIYANYSLEEIDKLIEQRQLFNSIELVFDIITNLQDSLKREKLQTQTHAQYVQEIHQALNYLVFDILP